MVNRVTRTVLFAASALLSMSAFGAGAAKFGTLRNSDWVVTNAWQAVSNKTHDLILEIGQGDSLPPDWQNVSNAAMNAVQSLQPAYDYSDSAIQNFSSTNSVLSGGPYLKTSYEGATVGYSYSPGGKIVFNPSEIYVSGDSYLTQVAIMSEETNGPLSSIQQYGGRFLTARQEMENYISTNNPTFVSAVLAAPLVGADPSDLSEIAEYGSYGTVGAALLALIAGLAALKRRMNAAETAIDGKASLSDLPYALVTPGEWEFSGIDQDEYEVSDPRWDSDIGNWSLKCVSKTSLIEHYFNAEGTPQDLTIVFPTGIDGPITATRASLPGHLLDRAGNRVVVSGDTTLTLPALVNAGKLRDFLVKVTTSADDLNITWQGQESEAPNGADELQFVTEDGDFPVVGTAGDYLFSFTEIEPHTFAVSMKPIVAAPQAQGGS